MPSTKTLLLASALAFASSVSAHMTISNPKPFGQSTLTSAPLAPDGSDFPCKQRPGVYEFEGAPNPPMAIGAPQTLAFLGGATHGGGSCQISLTTDKKPTKDSKWQVIHSIEGNCPDGFDGNLSGDPNDQGSSKFQYAIPEGIQPGEYVLAWTWFNRIGNREMYMNCAPITVIAASKKRDAQPAESTVQERQQSKRQSSFPDMFVANIGNGCTTAEGGNVKFPNPGAFIDLFPDFPTKPAVGSSCGAVSKVATSNDNGSSGGSDAPASPPAPSPATSSPAPAAPKASAPAPAQSSPPASKPVASPVASTAPKVPAPAASGTKSSAATGSCTSGKSVCSPDGRQIGTCDQDGRVTFVNVAKGTKCEGGYMVMAGGIRNRSAKFLGVHGPIRRGIPNSSW